MGTMHLYLEDFLDSMEDQLRLMLNAARAAFGDIEPPSSLFGLGKLRTSQLHYRDIQAVVNPARKVSWPPDQM